MIKIGIATASAQIKVSVLPKYAIGSITADSDTYSFTPEVDNPALIDPLDSSFIPQKTTATAIATPIGGIAFQKEVNISLGAPSNTLVPELLNAYLFKFPGFSFSGSDSSIEEGDLVYFRPNSGVIPGVDSFRCTLQKINVSNPQAGAFSQIFYFKDYDENSQLLRVFAKGYIEVPDSKLASWQTGRTLYAFNDNLFSIVPTTRKGDWVRSLGFCVPNLNNNKKLVWFDPDTTHIKLR